MNPTIFWVACAVVLIFLYAVWLYQGLNSKNPAFTTWLLISIGFQFLGLTGVAMHYPPWCYAAGRIAQWVGIAGAVVVIGYSVHHWGCSAKIRGWECPVNKIIVEGLGVMLAFQLGAWLFGNAETVATWLRNIACFGPFLYMLVCFSGLRMDRIPLWLRDEKPWSVANHMRIESAMAKISQEPKSEAFSK